MIHDRTLWQALTDRKGSQATDSSPQARTARPTHQRSPKPGKTTYGTHLIRFLFNNLNLLCNR